MFLAAVAVTLAAPAASRADEPDYDDDGVPDSADACPAATGEAEDHGCPPPQPWAAVNAAADVSIASDVRFRKGRDDLDASARAILSEVILVLQAQPDVRVRILGHTGGEGDHEASHRLSSRRAEAVRRFLVEGGVDQARLDTRPVGEDAPIASNESHSGRVKNRRVSFEVLPK